MGFNNVYKLVFFVIFVKLFCNINYFCFIRHFNLYQSSPSSSSFFFFVFFFSSSSSSSSSYYYYLQFFDVFGINSFLSLSPNGSRRNYSKQITQTRIRSSFEVLQHCPKKQRESNKFFSFFYLDRRTVMAVWTRKVVLFFETDVLKNCTAGDLHIAWEQRHAL